MSSYETIIGLEVHVHIKTKTKAFCGCSTEFGKQPNSQTCPVCLGLPGSLPVLNAQYLQFAIRTALAFNCSVSSFTKFDRKNYYYPDLPKNYQISQYDLPLALKGFIMISLDGKEKKIGITRVHMEEDAGKLIHDETQPISYVDYNRTGMPLLEIVSEPDMNSPEEAYEYLSNLKAILKYIEVSDCDMEKGSLRCDANISIRKKGEKKLGIKSELKNMNSFKAVKQALEFEINRQNKMISEGKAIIQETRLWDDQKQVSRQMRSKEEAHDYRYFPDPDLVPFTIGKKQIKQTESALPELPQARSKRFIKDYRLPEQDVNLIIHDKSLADYFEKCTKLLHEPKLISNWLIGPVMQELNERKISINELDFKPESLRSLIKLVSANTISNLVAKEVLKQAVESGKSPEEIVKEKNLAQVSDEGALKEIISGVLSENQKSVESYKEGKENAIMFLVGQVMKKSNGKANPKIVQELLRKEISND
ncbi:Asp-tRNA(Asn)/Glu-tRNA(Gln) amidotransferase subunit GatB [Candidatus Omnitrophota bacterium]